MRSLFGVVHLLGSVLALFSALFLLPIAAALYYHESAITPFLAGAGLSLAAGLLIRAATLRFRTDLKPRDAYLQVTLTWLVLATVATMPLLLLLPGLSFTRAFFESMSGLSTTGSTILSGLDALPHAVNLWRASLSWLGGMEMYRSETPGPVKDA